MRTCSVLCAALLLLCGTVRPSSALYSSRSDVLQLSDKDFDKQVLKDDGVVLVEFYAPWCGHCKNLAPAWDAAATALKGVAKVVAVDATQHQSLASRYQVQGFPTIKVFAANKSSPSDYNGNRDAKAIVDAALKEVRDLVKARIGGGSRGSKSSQSSDSHRQRRASASEPGGGQNVVTLTDDNFDELVVESGDVWFVEFYAPWCGHCKNLAPEWAEAADEMNGEVKFGALDATVHQSVASRFNIKGYPSIKMFPGGAKSDASALDYQGPRDASSIAAAAKKLGEETGGSTGVIELTSQSVFDDNCGGKRICIVAFLPDLLDEGKETRNARLGTIKELSDRQRRRPYKFLWTVGTVQPALKEKFGITALPAAVAVNKGKSLFAVSPGAFDIEHLNSFCDGLAYGRAVTQPLDAIPSIESVPEWDGEDAQEEVVEEEFSLDDIMNEEL